MSRRGFFILQLVLLLVARVYAQDTTNGYVVSIYGKALKSAYGECVHTAYYIAGADSRTECGDQIVASAPVAKVQVKPH